jgi:tetratricopeptide (TPR) repeat protein
VAPRLLAIGELGALQRDMGHLQEARPLLEESIAISRTSLGAGHPAVAPRLLVLGDLLMAMGDLEGARTVLEESLGISRKALGPDHPQIVITLGWLAELHG